jgi:triosephosphate isomerase
MKKLLVVGNWKMHLNTHQASLLVHRLDAHTKPERGVEIVLAPSLLCLQPLSLEIDRRKFRLSAQDAYFEDEGPYTGEVSFSMLRGLVHYCIIGHSARRVYFGESLEVVQKKVAACVRSGITPILCVGETHEERKNGETKQVIHDQLTTALANITSEEIEDIVIAYEPIWAISTFDGEVAKPSDMQQAMDFIRHQISELYGNRAAQNVRLLYGGSVNQHDARAYLEITGCDGVLVGAASLNYHQFAGIIDVAAKVHMEKLGEEKAEHHA